MLVRIPRWEVLASRLAIPGFVLPFLFVYNPELLMLEGSVSMRAALFVCLLVAFVALNAALSGTLLKSGMSVLSRCLFAASAIALVVPFLSLKIVGAFVLTVAVLGEVKQKGRNREPHKSRS